jgi:hypothetical protein
VSENQPSRIDQIEAALERQVQVNAELRTTAELLLQTVQLHQQQIEVIAQAFRQHRSDGHGA